MNEIERLRLIKNNPGVYKFLPDDKLADLLLQLLETKSLFKRAKVKIVNGVDGVTPKAGVDYMTRQQQEALLKDMVAGIKPPKNGKPGATGKDAEITDELIESIVSTVYDALFPTLPVPLTSEEIRDRLELLIENERLDISAIRGLDDYEEISKLARKPKIINGGGGGTNSIRKLKDVVLDGLTQDAQGNYILAGGSGSATSFETVSKNLDASDALLDYTGDNLTSITYTNNIIKTLSYTGDNLTSVVLSGTTPDGIDLTKTFSYTGDNLTGVAYS